VVPIRETRIDRQNPFRGAIPMGWSVGKPFLASDGTAYFQYSKCGCPPSKRYRCDLEVGYDEAWLFASKDIATATSAPTFATLPLGDVGLVAHNRTGNESMTTSAARATPSGNISGGCYLDCPPTADAGGCQPQLAHVVSVDDLHLTLEACGNACASLGYKLAGAEAGKRCMCGNTTSNPSALVPQIECSTVCSGAQHERCGGPNRTFVFEAMHRVRPKPRPPPNVDPRTGGVDSWIAEEGDLVELGNSTPSHLYYVYRTSDGYLSVGISKDGGLHFQSPMYAMYRDVLMNTTGWLKNPRGPITPRRFSNGRYLLLFFNRANGGIAGSRNPYFISAGTYDAKLGTILWSQPEIILYTKYITVETIKGDPVGSKLGYPDLFEHNGEYYMTETDKITARLHKFEPDLVNGLFMQGTARGLPSAIRPIFETAKPGRALSPLGDVDITAGDSLTVEAWVESIPLHSKARPVLICGHTNGTGRLLHFFAPGGHGRALASLFRGIANRSSVKAFASEQVDHLGGPGLHQVTMVVDGAAQIAMYYVDGVLLNGGAELGTGFAELAVLLRGERNNARAPASPIQRETCTVGPSVKRLRVYGSSAASDARGYLRTSEIAASFRAGHAATFPTHAIKTDEGDDAFGAASASFFYRAFAGYTSCTLTAPVRRCSSCTLLNQSFECGRFPNIAVTPRTTFLNGSAAACDYNTAGPGCGPAVGGVGTATQWDGEAIRGR
jgi:hypothetical protein